MAITSFTDQYRFLSNFHSSRIWYDGAMYNSVEHAYQAAKTTLHNERVRIRRAFTPGEAKKLGQRVTLRKDWEQVKLQVMEALLRDKFKGGPLKAALLNTGDEELVEGNWWGDTYWGVCAGKGENHLGKLLMKIRTELRAQEEGY